MRSSMTRFAPFYIVVAMTSAFAHGAPDTSQKLPLIVTDATLQFAPGTFPAKTKWQSLECDKAGCEVKSAKPVIVKTKVEHLDSELVPVLIFKPQKNVHALFANSAYPLGKVTTWFHTSTPDFDIYSYQEMPHAKAMKTKEGWRMKWSKAPITLVGTGIVTKYNDGEGYQTRYQVKDNTRVQDLFLVKEESQDGSAFVPVVRWVGDMDRDGKTDFIIEVPHNECGYDMRLYLSSKAGPHEIVGLAAQLDGYQEACGC